MPANLCCVLQQPSPKIVLSHLHRGINEKTFAYGKEMKRELTEKYFWCLLVFCASCTSVFAQAKFYASAGKQVPVNQNVQVNFVLENGEAKGFKAPSFSDFQVLSGPNTSQSVSFINGSMSQSITYSYVLRPKKEGIAKVGKASVSVGGATLESNELSIEVTAPAQQQAQQRKRGHNPFGMPDPFDDPFFDDPFGNQQQEAETPVNDAELNKELKQNVFLKLVLSDNNVYQGEQLNATLKLYFNYSIAQLQVSRALGVEGFWNQEVEIDPNQKPRVEEVNGKKYNVIDLQKFNLFPQRSGTLKITPAELSTVVQMQIRTGRRSVWDMFGGVRVQNVPFKLESNEGVVTVKELPVANKPALFSGAVGNYTCVTKVSSLQTKTDEPITYSITVSGKGNLKFIELAKPEMPQGFEVYDPKVKESIANTGAGFSGSKQYDFLIIPRLPGEYTIPTSEFSFFNTETGKYVVIKSPEFKLNVTGEASNTSITTLSTPAKEDLKSIGEDIRFIKTNVPNFEQAKNVFPASIGFGLSYASPFLLFIALVALKKRNENLEIDVVGTKRKRATKIAKSRLSVAKKHLAAGKKKEFYDEVSRAIWGYLGDKLNIDMASLSKENVEEKLTEKTVSHKTSGKLKTILNTCEIALYAPIGEGGEMKVNYEAAVSIIADLEDEIK